MPTMRFAALTVMCLAGLSLSSLASAQFSQPKFPPQLPEVAKEGYFKQFVPAAEHKAFVVSADGQRFSAVFGRNSVDEAARVASSACLAEHKVPCRIWLADKTEMFGSYAKTAQESARAVAKLPAGLGGKRFADEAVDYQVATPAGLRPGKEVHGLTPLAAPDGAERIETDALVKLYKSEKRLVVLDVLHSRSLTRSTLPKATWIYGGGWEQGELNKVIDSQFLLAMRSLAPRKDTPIVSYCSNRECWLSWNAALRLKQAGYEHVYWYRGGVDAWHAAGLPLVETPLFAHMW
ncbi:hypothetical protein J7U46_19060 [Pelomonas sp. V22]|uniref:rhodanese-like domain-containing protein n=1 Tax=Pelomonas sp. V22 TaxID=2822139 RepID=UPI0024A890EC|nr:rhodanese-like domain-containing protein [Pelomonas sp. V22]MDI4635170.1 hypothetical protein [Pelomonas sp. V22]